jgi:hypothetical protein
MDFSWVYDHSEVDWDELSELYRIAPLGEKSPKDLATVFSASKFKIILYANPEKEGFYRKLGFHKMNTAMAIFRNQKQAIESGVISET